MPRVQTRGFEEVGSSHVVQDRWDAEGSTAWVIDGATRRGGGSNDLTSVWVRALSESLRLALDMDASVALPDLLCLAIQRARLNVRHHPSATVAMARLSEEGVDYLVLGDAAVVVGKH